MKETKVLKDILPIFPQTRERKLQDTTIVYFHTEAQFSLRETHPGFPSVNKILQQHLLREKYRLLTKLQW